MSPSLRTTEKPGNLFYLLLWPRGPPACGAQITKAHRVIGGDLTCSFPEIKKKKKTSLCGSGTRAVSSRVTVLNGREE